jgi:hypothetical protein
MSIAYRSGSTAGNGSGGDLSVSTPAGVQNGDILIAVLYREAGSWTLPAGWTQIGGDQYSYDGWAILSAAWKRASSEGSSYTFQLSATTWRIAAIAAFSGTVGTGSPVDVYNYYNANQVDPVAYSLTTSAANDMLVALHGNYDGSDVAAGTSGYTQGTELGGCEIWYAAQASAGASGNKTFTRSSGVMGSWATFHVALLESTAPPVVSAKGRFLWGYGARFGAKNLVAQALNSKEAASPARGKAAWLAWFGFSEPAGATYTLSAAGGTFEMAGQATGLLAGYTLSAEPGSLALSGQSAGLPAGRLLPAAAGALSLTGFDAGLTYTPAPTGYTLSAEAGSLALGGQAAGLLAGRLLPAESGAVSLTGFDAGLMAGRKLAAAYGEIALSGQAAGLAFTRSLQAGAGSMNLTGLETGLLANRSMSGEAGGYALSGYAARLEGGLQTWTLAGVVAVIAGVTGAGTPSGEAWQSQSGAAEQSGSTSAGGAGEEWSTD